MTSPSSAASSVSGIEAACNQRTSLLDTPSCLGLLLAMAFHEGIDSDSFRQVFSQIHDDEKLGEIRNECVAAKTNATRVFSQVAGEWVDRRNRQRKVQRTREAEKKRKKKEEGNAVTNDSQLNGTEALYVGDRNIPISAPVLSTVPPIQAPLLLSSEQSDGCEETQSQVPGNEIIADEPALTKTLVDALELELFNSILLLKGETHLKRANKLEKSVTSALPQQGKVDILVADKTINSESPQSIGTIFEFGLSKVGQNHIFWWQKMHQNTIYTEIAKAQQNQEIRKWIFDQPMIIITITIGCLKVENNDNDESYYYQFGAFLCTTSTTGTRPKFSLLWHHHATTLDDAATAFGNGMLATALNIQLRTLKSDKYFRLGPSCCKVGDKVWRCYDSRLCGTYRKPFFYKTLLERAGESYERMVEYGDNENYFGEVVLDADARAKHFWGLEGKLFVIAVPFIVGEPIAKNPTDFIAPILFLHWMHQQGYVHGDIRAFNMVMNSEACKTWFDNKVLTAKKTSEFINSLFDNQCKDSMQQNVDGQRLGALIDFDYSGTKGCTLYPKGYADCLPDGNRMVGTDNRIILPSHDWYAFGSVIFEKHNFVHSATLDDQLDSIFTRHTKLRLMMQYIGENDNMEEKLKQLITFLIEAQKLGFTVIAEPKLLQGMKSCDKGTYSPPR